MVEQSWWEPLVAGMPAEMRVDVIAYATGDIDYDTLRTRTVARGEPDPERHVPPDYTPALLERQQQVVTGIVAHQQSLAVLYGAQRGPVDPALLEVAYEYAQTGDTAPGSRLSGLMREALRSARLGALSRAMRNNPPDDGYWQEFREFDALDAPWPTDEGEA